MATVKTIIEKAYTKVNGEYELMVETSDDFKTYLNVLNQAMEIWATTPYIKWQSLFDLDYTLPDEVAADTLFYPIADMDRIVMANSPLDNVYLLNGTAVVKTYKIVDQALFQSSKSGAICMLDADGIHFKYIDPTIVGTSINLPAYLLPALYTSGATEVRIDSVSWLITKMAAFICDSSPVPFISRNADKFEKETIPYMKAMRERNRHRQILSVKRVGDTKSGTLSQALTSGFGIGVGVIDDLDGGDF